MRQREASQGVPPGARLEASRAHPQVHRPRIPGARKEWGAKTMTIETHDPITLALFYHWELRRLKGSPQDFEQLFQDVAARAHDQFVRIRPYGRVGDRRIDGLYWGDGTAYQVYSPDEMKEADTRRKIEGDLAGA